ncbi:MAG: RNA polymerase sigma factor [Phycisphaerales bacterium]
MLDAFLNHAEPHLQALPRLVQADDEAAPVLRPVREWFEEAAPGVFRFLAVRAGAAGEHLVDDLMQQLWLAADKSADVLCGGEAHTWLRTVAKRLLITHWRRSGIRAALPIDDPALAGELAHTLTAGPMGTDLLARQEVMDQLRLAITHLATDEQDLLIEHYCRAVPQAALAQRYGVSERAIEGRLYRARNLLKNTLLGMGHGGPGAIA